MQVHRAQGLGGVPSGEGRGVFGAEDQLVCCQARGGGGRLLGRGRHGGTSGGLLVGLVLYIPSLSEQSEQPARRTQTLPACWRRMSLLRGSGLLRQRDHHFSTCYHLPTAGHPLLRMGRSPAFPAGPWVPEWHPAWLWAWSRIHGLALLLTGPWGSRDGTPRAWVHNGLILGSHFVTQSSGHPP